MEKEKKNKKEKADYKKQYIQARQRENKMLTAKLVGVPVRLSENYTIK